MKQTKNVKSEEDILAEEVMQDFLERQKERRRVERGWQMNMNFVGGKQYCDVNTKGELFEEEKDFYWQSKRVFNHISPIVDIRCSKLGRIRPELIVRAASDDDNDRHSASLASAILASKSEELDSVITQATVWSETCGTAFYKVMWDSSAGGTVGIGADGKKIGQGDIAVCAVSPFEIYPYNLYEEDIQAQPGIIHAKCMPVQDIYRMYGVRLAGSDLKQFGHVCDCGAQSDKAEGEKPRGGYCYELIIERYERPTEDRPQGRLTVVAGGKLLFDGCLPYVNGEGGAREYPFIKQTSLPLAGSFFGACVVDRLIPVQRAYNAVKNRKHEFLNRISMGMVAVEDGSVDTDELIEDGLTPGKIIVYRQGGKPPEMLTMGSVPSEFTSEEEKLLTEFYKVSGTGDITDNADSFAGITSATGLQLIIDQDDERMEFAYRQIKRAMCAAGRHILRLYKQFANDVRLLKLAGKDNVLSLYYFKGSDISSDDVCLDADNDASLSAAQKRSVIYDMLDRGLLSDDEGKLTVSAKNKVLEALGYAGFAVGRDLAKLNAQRAGEENLAMLKADAQVKSYDDHLAHIAEHTAFLLMEKLPDAAERRICAHMEQHRRLLNADGGYTAGERKELSKKEINYGRE